MAPAVAPPHWETPSGAAVPPLAGLPRFAEVSGPAQAIWASYEPGARLIETLERDWLVYVLAGFEDRAEGLVWYRVEYRYHRTESLFGWIQVPAATHREFVRPLSLACPTASLDVSTLAGMQPAEHLRCFDGRTITLRPVSVRQEPTARAFAGTPAWLAEQPDLSLHGAVPGGHEGAIAVHVDPASGVRLPRDQWLEVTVHVNHAAAETCRRTPVSELYPPEATDEQRLWCRQQLVVSSAVPVVP
jgi:hypothetical protein